MKLESRARRDGKRRKGWEEYGAAGRASHISPLSFPHLLSVSKPKWDPRGSVFEKRKSEKRLEKARQE